MCKVILFITIAFLIFKFETILSPVNLSEFIGSLKKSAFFLKINNSFWYIE